MKAGISLALALTAAAAFAQGTSAGPTGTGRVDAPVLRRLKQLGIESASLCSDSVFVRRAYLDVIGTLPTAGEVTSFLGDTRPNKRSALIDLLLEREEFSVYWAMKWSDLLRIKAEFPINLWPNAAQAYYVWLRTSLEENKPYDRFARELLTSSGSNFRVAPVNFYRAAESKDPNALAKAVALAFLGARADKWKPGRLRGMARFFTHVAFKPTQEWKEEVVYFDTIRARKDAAVKPLTAFCPDGTRVKLSPTRDPRLAFTDWLIAPKNPWFARCMVNRIWCWLMGRGIVHEPDDFRPDNPPSHPELLDLLAAELTAERYDLKHVYRLILNSKTYQRSCVAASNHPDAEAHFAHYAVRRLEAEVLIDAICQITGTTESYSSRIPEPFTWIPEHHRTIALPDGSITSSFLDLFGRPPRDTGLHAERSNKPSAAQRLHLLNSSHILGKMNRSRRLGKLMRITGGDLRPPATRLYLTILSRLPTEDELKVVEAYSRGEETKGQKALTDLAWALVNSSEFQYRH